ncbi:hypothetical protein D621_14880 [beta proteobacterium AAP51]|nr:hypothetical protein D621_14880 [beta proteobacterium AAP51]
MNIATPLHPSETHTPLALLTPERLKLVKRSYNTRRIAATDLSALQADTTAVPRAGDLVLARVERIGKHPALELTDSRRSTLFVGDEVLVAYAARYAPDQFEARVPDTLGPCHLAASGGVAAEVVSRRAGTPAPTELRPLGLVLDAQGQRVNLLRTALPLGTAQDARPLTLASLGTSMNAGKTTSAAHLIYGLKRAGLRVGGAKITGTGSGNDPGLLGDAGADWVLDFTHCGYASTFELGLEQLLGILYTVQAQMHAKAVDVLVLEVADGLLQQETAALLRSEKFRERVDGCIFSSGEAMGAIAGADWLRSQQLPLLALSGAMTRSPLSSAEAAGATGVQTLGLESLRDPGTVRDILARASRTSLATEAA